MKQSCQIIVAIIILLDFSLISHQQCLKRQTILRSIIRGKYKNVLHISNGGLISSKIYNGFRTTSSGNCLRDPIYEINSSNGFIYCLQGFSIQLKLLQKYELNTLKIWIWDRDNRFQTLQVFVKVGNVETKIYESIIAQSIVTITFPEQFVEEFRIQQQCLFDIKFKHYLYLILLVIEINLNKQLYSQLRITFDQS